MEFSSRKVKFFCGIVIPLAMAIGMAGSAPGSISQFPGAASDYSITLDTSNAPSGLTASPTSNSFLGPKNVAFYYSNAMANSGGLITLNNSSNGYLGNHDQITTIKSYRVDFQGDCQISFGWEYGVAMVALSQGESLQTGLTYTIGDDYYFFSLSASSGTVEIDSVTITYSCVPTPPAPEYTLAPNGLSYIVTGTTKNPYDIVVPETYLGLPVTEIGASAFYSLFALESVYLPDSITKIGIGAFEECTNLASVRLPAGLLELPDNVFYNCSSLTDIPLPSTLRTIGIYAFYNTAITSLTIPSSVTNFGIGCFSSTAALTSLSFQTPLGVSYIAAHQFEASGLSSITLPEGIVRVDEYAFSGSEIASIQFPATLTTIGGMAFSYTTNLISMTGTTANINDIGYGAFQESAWQNALEMVDPLVIFDGRIVLKGSGVTSSSLSLPEGVTHITPYAFEYNNNIVSVTTPSTLVAIGEGAFGGSSFLTTMNLSASTNLQNIGGYAFSDCSELLTMTIPASVLDVGDDAFLNTGWLAAQPVPLIINDRVVIKGHASGSITLPSTVTRISNEAFKDSSITSITLPTGLTSIGPSAFSNCASLTALSVPNSVTFIGDNALEFSGIETLTLGSGITYVTAALCYNAQHLATVTFPSTITAIHPAAFMGCAALTGVTIPTTVDSIGMNAFAGCSSLTSISIPGATTYIGEMAFLNSGLQTVTLNEGLLTMADSVFEGCAVLTSINLPTTLTSIGNHAFDGCEDLDAIIIPANVSFVGESCFLACVSLSIYVRASSTGLPTGWNASWNPSGRPVTYDYAGS
jgi:hypothetical protein